MNKTLSSNEIITLEKVKSYLLNNDWVHRNDYPNKKVMVFNNIEEDIDIVIPSDETYKDFFVSVSRTLNILSEIEERAPGAILMDIQKIDIDRLSLRRSIEWSMYGTLSLSEASTIVGSLKDLVIAASCNEYEPRPYHKRPLKKAMEYSDKFSFAHTEQGSFIFNIESPPINPEERLTISNEGKIIEEIDVPITRKIFHRIAYSMEQLNDAVSKDSIDSLINDGYLTGLNANMCDALINITPSYSDEVVNELMFRLSPSIPKQNGISNNYEIKKSFKSVLKAVSESLKNSNQEYHATLLGYVKELFSDNPMSDSSDKRIQISITNIRMDFDERNEIQNCFALLNAEQYTLAWRWHKDNSFIQARGILRKSNNRWWLEDITHISKYSHE